MERKLQDFLQHSIRNVCFLCLGLTTKVIDILKFEGGSSSTRGTVTVKRSTSNRGRGLSTSRKPQSNFSVPKPVNLEFEPTLNSQKKNTEQSNDASESTSNAQTNSGIVNAWTTKPSDDSEKNNAWENNKSESSIINDEAFPSLGKDESRYLIMSV